MFETTPQWQPGTSISPGKNNGNSSGNSGSSNSTGLQWPVPHELRRKLPPSEPFPIDALGRVLTPPAKIMRKVIQCPEALCGQSLLAAATLAVQGHANVCIDGRDIPLSNNFITIAESGERKTAVDNVVLSPHSKRQRDLQKDQESQYHTYQAEHAAWKKAKEEALSKSNATTVDAKKKAVLALGPEPKPPIDAILTVEEPTYEGLVKSLVAGQPSVGIFSDEGGRFLGGHGMNSENQLKTAAGLSKLWDGSPITRTRAGDGNTAIYGKRVSVHLMIQPSVSSILFGNSLFANQGLLARCLASYPESTIGNRPYKKIELKREQEMMDYSYALTTIMDTPLPLKKDTQNELNPRELPLSVNGKPIWIDFHDYIESQCKEGGRFYSIKGFAAKSAEHAARLAGVLTLIDDLNAINIGKTYIQSGITLMEYYLGEALRLFHSAKDDEDLILAEELLRWAQSQQGLIYPQLVYQNGPNQIRNKKTAQKVIKILVDHGWFREIEGGAVINNVNRKLAYEVHP